MNFTLIASILSVLIVCALISSVNVPVITVDYMPLEKVRALDYIAVVNALVYSQNNGGGFESFLTREVDANFTVVELVIDAGVKRAVVEFDHGWTKTRITVFLSLKILGEYEKQDIAGNRVKYILVEVSLDKPVQLYGGKLVSCNGTRYIVELSEGAVVRDSRGLEVRV